MQGEKDNTMEFSCFPFLEGPGQENSWLAPVGFKLEHSMCRHDL